MPSTVAEMIMAQREELASELRSGEFETSSSGARILESSLARGFSGVFEMLDTEVNGPHHESFSPGDVGRALERELRLLLCAKDVKYADLREELLRAKHSARQVGVLVATTIAAQWNLNAGLLTPFVLVFLLGIVDISVQAWCAGKSIESLK